MECKNSLFYFRRIIQAGIKYNSYNSRYWIKVYFNPILGGFNVYHKNHQFSKIEGGGNAEKIVGRMLAKYNGKQVEFLEEQGMGQSKPDLRFDNQTWDIKFIEKAKEETIRKCIKNARKADNALFYFGNADKERELRNAVDREVRKYRGKGELYRMPNIYYMDKEQLKLLWKK
jgi:transposase-like protein